MTANGGQKGRGGRNPRTSARLSLGPEDDWRSWSKLPADGSGGQPDSADEDTDEPVATDELEGRLRGSMMVVVAPTEPAPPASLPEPDLPPPTEITTQLPVVAEPAAAPAPRTSARPAAPNHPSAGRPRATPTAAPASTPAPVVAAASEAPAPVAEEQPARGRPYGDPRRMKKPGSGEIAIVLVSDPAVVEAEAEAPRPAAARQRAKAAGTPRPSSTREPRPAGASRDDSPSVSGLMAEAVSLLEARVTKQAEEIESLLEELEIRYDDELARLDDEVHRELSNRPQGIPKEFEDRVHASFMQLVERLERLESGRAAPAPAPAAPAAATPAPVEPEPPVSVATARPAEAPLPAEAPRPAGDPQLVATVDAVLRRQDEVTAEHRSLAEQHRALADAQRSAAAGQQQIAGQLEAALATVAELSQQVAQLVAAIPDADRRLAGLERHTASQLALFQARVDDLSERFPAVEGAVEVVTRHTDAIGELRNTMDQFRAALDHEVSGVHRRIDEVDAMRAEVAALQERAGTSAMQFAELAGRLDTADERTTQIADAASALNADFLRLQAETDRRSSAAEARVLDLEDAIGGEVGVERNLLLDRIEEMERGLYELDPDSFVRRDDLSGSGPVTDGPVGPGH